MKTFYPILMVGIILLFVNIGSAQCVNDTTPPTVITQNIVLTTNSSGQITLSPAQVDAGSNDNCGIASLSVQPNSFSCADLGSFQVTLTATDSSGNSSSNSATVELVAECEGPIDLNQWVQEGVDSTGNWDVSPDGNSVLQTINANPTFYVSTGDYFNTVIEGQIEVETGVDDDFIGFVLGVQNPTGLNQNNHDFILFDWKQNTQYKSSCGGFADAGMRLSRVTGSAVTEQDYYETFWCKNSPDVEILATNTTMGGWQDFTTYNFRAEYFQDRIKIFINNILVFDESGTFQNGRFGFYNFSQPNVRYNGFTEPFDISLSITDGCPSIPTEVVATPSNGAPGPYTYTWSNGGTGNTQTGLPAGTHWVEVQSANCCVVRDTFQINTTDLDAPVLLVSGTSLQLDQSGNASLSFNDIDQGSYDNCGIASVHLSQTQFDCGGIGHENKVLVTLTDHSGNQSSTYVTILIVDPFSGIPANQVANAYLDFGGQASSNTSDFNLSSGSACPVDSAYLSPDQFNCSQIGLNDVFIITINGKGGRDSIPAQVNVIDTLAPVMCCCKPDTVQLDSNGVFQVDLNFIQSHSAGRDNCGQVLYSSNIAQFSTNDIGLNTITYITEDGSGNKDSCQTTVFVELPEPKAVCKDITILVDDNGQVSIQASDVDGGSSAAGGIDTMYISQSTFTCNELGANTVLLIVENSEGVKDTCQATITVEKNCSAPVDLNNWVQEGDLALGDWTVGSNQNEVYQSENDNPTFYINTAVAINTTIEGSFEIESTVDDDFVGFVLGYQGPNSGTGTGDYDFLLFDWKQGTQYKSSCGGTAQAGMSLSRVNGSAYSEADVYSLFWCKNVPEVEVLATNTSIGGWQDYTTYNFKVAYESNRVRIWINGNLIFDESGTFEPGRFGFYNFSQPFVRYTGVVENFSVLASGTDPSCPGANDGTATANASGQGGASLSYLWSNGATSQSISGLAAGVYTVEVTASNCCLAYDTLYLYDQDTINPTALGHDTTLFLTENGTVQLSASDVNNGSFDNCQLDTLYISPNTFSCDDAGQNTVMLTAVDASGNVGTTQLTVNVEFECSAPIDLNTWVQEGVPANGNWQTNTEGSLVSQEENLNPTFYVSTETYFNTVIEGSFSVETGVDDDFIGFVLGYQDPTPVNQSQHDFILFDWKQNAQYKSECGGTAPAEMRLSRVNGTAVTTNELYKLFWCKNVGDVNVLANNASMGGWQDFTTYNFKVAYTANRIQIWINGGLVFDVNGSFNPGRFGFYNFSQPDVQYNSFELPLSVQIDKVDASCPGGNDGVLSALVSGTNESSLSYEWSTGDTSSSISGLGQGTYWVKVQNGACCVAYDTVQVVDQDTIPPSFQVQDTSLVLDGNCEIDLTALIPSMNASDNCKLDTVVLSPSTIQGLDTVLVTVTTTDESGNSSSDDFTVITKDETAPTTNCVNDITLCLGAGGTAKISTVDVDNGSVDACGPVSLSLDQTSFTCTDLGANTVTMTVTDPSGNTSTCQTTVTVLDTIAPVINVQTTTIYLNQDGQEWLMASTLDNGTSDNCGIDSIWIDQKDFDCSYLGSYPVEFYAVDASGNVSGTTVNIQVLDTISPTASVTDTTIYLETDGTASIDASYVINSINENCTVETISINPNDFDCNDVGQNTVDIIITDQSGNQFTTQVIVTVRDTISPDFDSNDTTMYVDENGQANANVQDLSSNERDNCQVDDVSMNRSSSFNCADLGQNIVDITVTDINGNSTTKPATVTILDTISPIVVCQNDTVFLDSSGQGSVQESDLVVTSTDNCGNPNLSLSQTNFTSQDAGNNQVIVTATDASGNTSTCISIVTVIIPKPNAICKDTTVYLDENGLVSIDPSFLNNGSNSQLPIQGFGLTESSFDCSDIGANTVGLFLWNSINEYDTCFATVTVLDTTKPDLTCNNISLNLDPNGQATVDAADISSFADNCAGTTLDFVSRTFDCTEVGTHQIQITATDASGNQSVCTSTVTVLDQTPPQAICQDVQVYLNASGSATVQPSDVNNGSTDNCGISQVQLSKTNFACTDVGTNTVSLQVTDAAGNIGICTATVTVIDTFSTSASCQDVTLALDANGQAILDPVAFVSGGLSACGVDSVAVCVSECIPVDFDTDENGLPLANGTRITNQLAGYGITNVSATGGIGQAWIFDSSNPSSEDVDLGTPNQAFGGPGIGSGGSSNQTSLGNLIIIQEHNGIPDDNGSGGTLTFTLSGYPSIQGFRFVDIEESGGSVVVTTASGTVSASVPGVGDNSQQYVPLTADSATQIVINFIGSGALGEIDMCSACHSNTFDCSDIGNHQVNVQVFEQGGTISECTASLTVVDNMAPTAIGQNVNLDLNGGASVSITPNDVDNGSFDNCGIVNKSISQSVFDCDDIGTNNLWLVVEDAQGLVDSSLVQVTLTDGNAGLSINCPADILVECSDANDPVTWADPTAYFTSSACGAAPCSDTVKSGFIYMGTYNGSMYFCSNKSNFTWSAAKNAANQAGGQLVSINNAGENAFVRNIQGASFMWLGYTDEANEGSFVWSDGSQSSYSNWNANEPNNQGSNGCGSQADYTVIKKSDGKWFDRSNCETYEFMMEVPCTGSAYSIEQISGPTKGTVLSPGGYTLTYAAHSNDGNYHDTCSFNISVTQGGSQPPVAVCKNYTGQLIAGNLTIDSSHVDNGSYAACGDVQTMSVQPNSFSSPGTYTVTLTVVDEFGNSDQCTAQVTVLAGPCTASASNSSYEWIESVGIGNFAYTSGNDGGYGDHTNQTVQLVAGQSVSVDLTPGFASQSYDEYWKIWIDFNQDGDFNDAGEKVFFNHGHGNIIGNFTVPSSALGGVTIMRVFMKWNGYPSGPCAHYEYGEVEDYKVNLVIPSGGATQEEDPQNLPEETIGEVASIEVTNLYPVPLNVNAHDNLYFEFRSAHTAEVQVRIRNVIGGEVAIMQPVLVTKGENRLSIPVSDLTDGNYTFEMIDVEGRVALRKFLVVD